jgi:AcrR family transcriptional regulator
MPRARTIVAGRDTRQRILAAARDLFYEKGYTATGLAEILQRAEANSGSFYYFFESKEALLGVVLDEYVDALRPVLLDPIYARVRDPIDRIFALLEKYRSLVLATGFGYACPIGRIAFEVEPEMERIHARVAANFAGWSAAIHENLEAARDRFPRGCDLRRLSVFVLTVMEGAVMQARSFKSVTPFDDSVAALREYFEVLERQPRSRRSRVRSSTRR